MSVWRHPEYRGRKFCRLAHWLSFANLPFAVVALVTSFTYLLSWDLTSLLSLVSRILGISITIAVLFSGVAGIKALGNKEF